MVSYSYSSIIAPPLPPLLFGKSKGYNSLGDLKEVLYGEALSDRPEDDPRYPVLYYIVFYRKGNSFTYLVQKFASTLTAVIQSLYIVNKSQTITFSRILQSHKMYLLAQFFGHFADRYARLSYLFIYFNKRNPYPFIYLMP